LGRVLPEDHPWATLNELDYACVQGVVCSKNNRSHSFFHCSTASIVLTDAQLAQAECHMFLRYEPVSRTEYFCNNPLGLPVMCRKHVSRAPPASPQQNAMIRSRSRVSNTLKTPHRQIRTTTPAPTARLAQGASDQNVSFHVCALMPFVSIVRVFHVKILERCSCTPFRRAEQPSP
jgi:hypothetical protein